MKPTDFAYHLSKYLTDYLSGARGLSSNTIASRRDTFSLLLVFCKDKKRMPVERIQIQTITPELIAEFLVWLELRRNCCESTRNLRLASIKAFFKYLQSLVPEHMFLCQQILAIPSKKVHMDSVDYLSLDGIKAILDSIDVMNPSGRRDLVLLSLLYDSGARVQELADLTTGALRLHKPAIIRLTGKGNKTRIVPLMDATAQLLSQYVLEQNKAAPAYGKHPLFVNRSGKQLTRAGINFILNKYVLLARVTKPSLIPDSVSAHSFRHSKAMHMLQAGVPLIYIRDFLGHSEIATTEIYARCDSKAKREAFESAYASPNHSGLPSWQRNDDLLGWLRSLGQ